jgi:hypothetical protein
MANVKQIPSVLSEYIPPLVGVVNHDSISCDFEYMLITAYILKGIRVVRPQLGHIPTLKNRDFNLGDRKNYMILTPHWYLRKMTGKKPQIFSHLWIKELAQSTILCVMKIPHYD